MVSYIRRAQRPQWSLTALIVGINVAVYLLLQLFAIYVHFNPDSSLEGVFESFFVLSPQRLVENAPLYAITLLTSMFTHVLFTHLLVNMVSLFFVGSFVERLIGKRRYFWLYMISGLVAGLSFVVFAYVGSAFSWGTSVFGAVDAGAVGASGALFGIAGLLAMLLPRLRVLVFFVIPMPMWGAMILLIAGLWIVSIAVGLPVGNTAHLGGLIVGLIYGWYLRTKYSKKVAMLGRMFQ